MGANTSGRYNMEKRFFEQELFGMQQEDVTCWMMMKLYGSNEEGEPDTTGKILIRSSTLEVMKNSLSWYMPNRLSNWNTATLEVMKNSLSWYMPNRLSNWNKENVSENPTKSTNVNDLIKFIKKVEVRRIGKASNAKRPITMAEFRKALELLEKNNNFEYRFRMTTMLKYQYHLVGRCDNLCNFGIHDLFGHSDPRWCLFCLEIKVFWSKNANEERDCPDQILFGCHDVDFCILLALACYLKIWFIAGIGTNSVLLFSDEHDDCEGKRKHVKRAKKYMERMGKAVFEKEEFRSVGRVFGLNLLLGTHSLRKFPATFARNNCCTIDEIDIRGRWKRDTKRISDRYIDVKQPWIDGKVASALCPGGPCKYKLVPGSGITRDWLRSSVVPGISGFYGDHNTVSDVLALPLLWACLDPSYSSRLPAWLTTRVRTAYDSIKVLPDPNPVRKVLLLVCNIQGQLAVHPAVATVGGADGAEYNVVGGNNNNNNMININSNDQLNALLLQQQQIHSKLGELSETLTTSVSQGLFNLKKEMDSLGLR